jgi:hypothetical protein
MIKIIFNIKEKILKIFSENRINIHKIICVIKFNDF